MSTRGRNLAGTATLTILVSLGFGVWDRWEAHRRAEADVTRRDNHRLAGVEARVCELEGRIWYKGDCLEAP